MNADKYVKIDWINRGVDNISGNLILFQLIEYTQNHV